MQKILVLIFTCLFSFLSATDIAILEAVIELQSPSSGNSTNIQPCSTLNLKAIVKNIGTRKNEKGTIFIQFTLPHPLDKETNSLLFKTESLELPSIEPNESVTISFNTSQQLPNVQNFIRNDWTMRQYQAIAEIEDRSFLIGTRTLTFSTHYYQGPIHELPTPIN